MTWVTILWPMVTGASVTMALIHLRIGRRHTSGTAQLLFSLSAFVVTAFSCLEFRGRADSEPQSPPQEDSGQLGRLIIRSCRGKTMQVRVHSFCPPDPTLL